MGSDRDLHRRLLAESLSERFGLALIEGDAAGAERVAREAVDEELTHALIHEGVITPALHRIGVLWERGEIGVAHEHMATQIALRVLALLRETFRVARERGDQRVLLAAVQGEHHFVALQMAADLLEDAGYDVVMLGPDVPTRALADVVSEHRPQLVALSSTMSSSAAELPRAIDAVRTASPTTGVIVGGRHRAPTRLPEPSDVTFTGSVVDVVETADALVRRPNLN
jgi:methanogenic corrinoid protein MtbC1